MPLLVCAVLLAGCRKEPTADVAANGAASAVGAARQDAAAGAAAAPDAKAGKFDVASVPLSTVPLGDFPYISLPAGYSAEGRTDKTLDFARFPFWVKDHSQWVEGRFHLFEFDADEEKAYSQLEVRRNIEALVKQMGGVEVSTGKVPGVEVEAWGDEITSGFNGGLGDVYNEPVTTYLVRRDGGNIWIHLVTNTAQGWMVVGQEKGFTATAKLLPASELKQQLDSAGKVALEVNFATDKTAILDASLPQVDQVVQLLRDDMALQLAVNGHTDNSGDRAHNQQLSEGRAQAVVAAIVAKGIPAERLQARGFGDSEPVADNGSDEGRARNRRVELVKR